MIKTMRDLQKDLELCNAATPGPWKVKELIGPYTEELSVRTADDMPICEAGGALKYPEDRANARFIAEAREGWPEAIKRAMEAETRAAELKKALREVLAAERCDECIIAGCRIGCRCPCHDREEIARAQAKRLLRRLEREEQA